jgi:glutamyl-tRNA reductase
MGRAVTDRGYFCTGGQTTGEVWTPPHEFAARALANVRLYDMDDLSAVVAAHHPIAAQAIAAAEEIVAQEVVGFLAWWCERQIAPLIVSLRSQAEEIRHRK